MSGGGLGNALGAVLLGAPVLLGGMRLLLGTAKSIFANGLTPMTAPWVKVANVGGGAMGGPMGGPMGMGSQFAGGSFSAGKQALAQRRMMMGGGLGLGAMASGMLTSAITSNMEAGEGRTAVSTVGGAATGALTGAAIGSIFPVVGTAVGAAVGGLIGGISSLVSEMKATREKEDADKATREENQKRTQEILEQMSVRPIELNVTNETIGKWNTYSSQNGANNSFA